MTTLASFWVEGRPAAQPRTRSRRGRHYTPDTGGRSKRGPSIRVWKGVVALAAGPHLPPEPYDEPLCVDLQFFLDRPNAHYRGKSTALKADAPKVVGVKPDFDNLAKGTIDALSEFWVDDSRIWEARVSMYYADPHPPGCRIHIWRSDFI